MKEYYTMESVRDQIVGKYDCKSQVLPENWDKYPCPVYEKCRAGQCTGTVGIHLHQKNNSFLLLEISFFKIKQRGYIRKNCTQLIRMIELQIIDTNLLKTEML